MNENVINLLRFEVVKKGQSATYAFIAFGIFSYWYGFGCVQFLPIIKGVSLFLVVVNFLRFFYFKKLIAKNGMTDKEWINSLVIILLNGSGLSLILSLAAFELKLSGFPFIVSTTLLAGLVGASTVTLSYFPVLFLPFLSILIIPQIGIILYYSFQDQQFLALIFLYMMYFFYQTKQFSSYRKDLDKLFTYQLELETKNQELNDSKNIIIEQTVKLVHASRLSVLGEMSAGVGHEINNPLTIIYTCVNKLIKMGNSNTLDNESVINYSEKIVKSVQRISSIVNGLKHFSNQSDRVPKSRISIQEIISETSLFCSEHFNSLGISFKIANIPDVGIHCHSVQISQVLINLFKNASDALAFEDKTEEKWIAVDFKKDEKYFYFVISNGGARIPQEIAAEIFKPFFTTKDNNKGTGLGLSISQTIMKDHGGELYFDSENLDNTTFVVKHPI
jgi:signal transduction histidine kinase